MTSSIRIGLIISFLVSITQQFFKNTNISRTLHMQIHVKRVCMNCVRSSYRWTCAWKPAYAVVAFGFNSKSPPPNKCSQQYFIQVSYRTGQQNFHTSTWQDFFLIEFRSDPEWNQRLFVKSQGTESSLRTREGQEFFQCHPPDLQCKCQMVCAHSCL